MEYWQRNEDGARFDSEEDAYQDFLENEDVGTLEDYLLTMVGLDVSALLHWAMSQDGFWEAFQDEITEAREMMFEDTYSNWEDSDDDEIDELVTYIEQTGAARPKKQYAVDAQGDLYEVNPTE